jgi:hypothetical protein
VKFSAIRIEALDGGDVGEDGTSIDASSFISTVTLVELEKGFCFLNADILSILIELLSVCRLLVN